MKKGIHMPIYMQKCELPPNKLSERGRGDEDKKLK